MKSLLTVTALTFSLLGFSGEMRNTDSNSERKLTNIIYEVRLKINHGKTTWSEEFAPAGESPIQILLVDESSCRAPYIDVYVKIAATQKWEHTNFTGGYDYFSGGPIDGIRFDMDQPWYNSVTCTLRAYSNVGQVNQPTANEELVGALTYNGGYVAHSELPLVIPKFVKGIRFDVPSFCPNVSILNAVTYTEGIADVAKPSDAKKSHFLVNNGSGARISKLAAALNGPTGSQCDIPVFVY